MVDISCKICGNKSFSYLCKGIDRFCFVEGDYDLYKCDKCGLILIAPYLQQDILKKYYPDNYYSYSDTDRMQEDIGSAKNKLIFYLKHPIKAANCMVYSKILRQKDCLSYKKDIDILDIGCGDGRYLLEKRRYGCNCFGVDINKEALDKLKKADSNITVYCGNLWEAKFPDNHFDIVNLSSVLEHIVDIDTLLQEINRILKEEGVLRIQVPNSSSMTYKIFGKYWMGLDVPRHVYTFSINNLKLLFKKVNFKVGSYRTVENSYDFICSIIYVYNSIFKKKCEIMKCSNVWDNELLKLLFSPYAFLVNALKVGDSVEFVLKKE